MVNKNGHNKLAKKLRPKNVKKNAKSMIKTEKNIVEKQEKNGEKC